MTDEEPPPQPTWQGVWSFGGDLQISDLSFAIGEDGNFTASTPTVRVRTDLWPFWLHDAVDAAEAACRAAERIGPLIARLDAAGSDEEARRPIREELTSVLFRELRACMRTMTACAFAFDALYATVKDRCGPHPHDVDGTWTRNRTARYKRITETLRYHLKISKRDVARQLKSAVTQMFRFRDWAVHMAAEFREPVARADLRASVDWHFVAFQCENALKAVGLTAQVLDYLVSVMDRNPELAKGQAIARQRMDDIFTDYNAVAALTKFDRFSGPKPATEETA